MASCAHPIALDCPFCGIAAAYPCDASTTSTPQKLSDYVPQDPFVQKYDDLQLNAPETGVPRLRGPCFPILAGPNVLAFLDIMPMTRGHLLVTSRGHWEKVGHLETDMAAKIGQWLPIIARVTAKVTGCEDYNIVQNNGARAAQVVPHVHFHIIPRNTDLRDIRAQSWTMFGKGQREDLNDKEGEKLAAALRAELRLELKRLESKGLSKL